jgi:predicted ester cyclase
MAPSPLSERPAAEDSALAPAEVARSYFAAVAARDAEAQLAHWHPEGIVDLVPIGIRRGQAEIGAFFRELYGAIPDLETLVDGIVADERCAVVQWRMSGHFTGGSFQGLDATGGRIMLRGVDVVEVEDSKVVRNTAYYDGLDFARGVGLLPRQDSGAERAMFGAFNGLTRARRALRAARGR